MQNYLTAFLFFLSLIHLPIETFGADQPVLLSDPKSVQNYNLHSKLQWDWALSSIKKAKLSGINPKRVLDVGSGDGKVTSFLASQFPKSGVTGIDVSDEMVKFSNSNFGESNGQNLSFKKKDVLELPFLKDSTPETIEEFDFIVSFSCLHWVKNQTEALSRIYQSLSPGGKVLLVLPGHAPNTLKSFADIVRARPEWRNHFEGFQYNRWYFTPSEYQNLLKSVGFSKPEVTQVSSDTTLPSVQALSQWLAPVSPSVHYLEEPLKTRFLNEVVQLYLSHFPPEPDGTVHLHWPKLEAWAMK